MILGQEVGVLVAELFINFITLHVQLQQLFSGREQAFCRIICSK